MKKQLSLSEFMWQMGRILVTRVKIMIYSNDHSGGKKMTIWMSIFELNRLNLIFNATKKKANKRQKGILCLNFHSFDYFVIILKTSISRVHFQADTNNRLLSVKINNSLLNSHSCASYHSHISKPNRCPVFHIVLIAHHIKDFSDSRTGL